jgi:ABC-type polysaccharide/polyol phosphate export permease
MTKIVALIGMIAFVVVLLAIGPLAVIWAWNTLFPAVVVQFTFWTWLAVVILGAFFRANVSIKKD